MNKLIILGLSTVQALSLVGGSTVFDITQRRYVDGVDLIHRDGFEGEDGVIEWDVGRTEIRYDMTDVVMRGQWGPEAGQSWAITTDEWTVTLSLKDPPWTVRDFGPYRPPETYYAFDLRLERSDGGWSHTFRNLGNWSSRQWGPFEYDGSIASEGWLAVGTFPQYEAPMGWRDTHITIPDRIPFDIRNGGITDTGWDSMLNVYGQISLRDIPVNDDWWLFSLRVGFEEGDMLARIGLGHEISRETFLIVPEPGTGSLLVAGMFLVGGCWLMGSCGGKART
jgi:hypothetical protein